MKEYCHCCGQLLPVNIFGKIKAYEFKEGFYCEGCAKRRVELAKRTGGVKR